ncbi:MAG TPA: response regulator [Blastocatellia bacterium]|nr:response regulator [Blastocatellia bacterium]
MKSMLLIDGSEIISKLFAGVFEKRGWEVVTCDGRDCAVERLSDEVRYDAILVGDRVPGASGVQLVRLIRTLDHRRTTAVVVVTARVESADEALAAGADEALVKPVNPYALVWAVDKHVS